MNLINNKIEILEGWKEDNNKLNFKEIKIEDNNIPEADIEEYINKELNENKEVEKVIDNIGRLIIKTCTGKELEEVLEEIN